MLLEIGLLKTKNNKKQQQQKNKNKNKNKTKQNKSQKEKKNQNCIKSGLSQFLFLQQKMYVALMAIFIIFSIITVILITIKIPRCSKKKDFPKEKSDLRGAEGSASLR